MFFTPLASLCYSVAKHYKACLMGLRPSSLHWREVGGAGFGVQWSLRAVGHLGPIREETGVGE